MIEKIKDEIIVAISGKPLRQLRSLTTIYEPGECYTEEDVLLLIIDEALGDKLETACQKEKAMTEASET